MSVKEGPPRSIRPGRYFKPFEYRPEMFNPFVSDEFEIPGIGRGRVELRQVSDDELRATFPDVVLWMTEDERGETIIAVRETDSLADHPYSVLQLVVEVDIEDGLFLSDELDEGLNCFLDLGKILINSTGVYRYGDGHVILAYQEWGRFGRQILVPSNLDGEPPSFLLEKLRLNFQQVKT